MRETTVADSKAIAGCLTVALALLTGRVHAAEPVWVRLYNGVTADHINSAADIGADPDGNVYVCGSGEDEYRDNCDMLLVVYRGDGQFLDAKAIGGYRWARDDMAHSLAIDQNGGVYVAGFTVNDPPQRGEDITWARFALVHDTLARTWARKTLWLGDDRAFDIVTGRYDDVYVCGTDRRDTLQPDISAFTVMRARSTTGSITWSRSLALDRGAVGVARRDLHPSFLSEWNAWDNCATSMAVTQDGSVVVAGFGLNGLTGRDVWVMEFDTAGNRQWSTTYLNGGPYDDVAFDVAIAQDRTIYVAGLTESEYNLHDFLVLRLADTGGVLNSYVYNGMPEGMDFASALVLDEATPQNVYVTGTSEHALRGYQVLTQKLDRELVPLWGQDGAKFGWAGDDFGYAIAFNKCRAYVAGMVSDNVSVICYSDSSVAGGETLWTYTYGSPDHLQDWGASLCVTDTDHIYLAGQCDRIDSVYDWTSMFTARLQTSPPGIQENRGLTRARLVLMPNPFRGSGTLALCARGRSACDVTAYDVLGRSRAVLAERIRLTGRVSIPVDLTGLEAGLYVVRVSEHGGTELGSLKVAVP